MTILYRYESNLYYIFALVYILLVITSNTDFSKLWKRYCNISKTYSNLELFNNIKYQQICSNQVVDER